MIGKVTEVAKGERKVFKVSGKEIAVFNIGGTFYAISDICRYGGDSLIEGLLSGYIIKCSKHDCEYDLMSGHCKNYSGMSIESFPIRIKNDEIIISIKRPRDFDNWKANYRKIEGPLD
tara:strand:+ start:381 stop:734 length:354 start_codon:yes stop_codon:yes gene_type:complete